MALIYRGPASRAGCPEAVAALLQNNPMSFRTVFVGPAESVQLSPATLATAAVYAQPGGGSVDSAWHRMRQHADAIKNWVRAGGHYLGFCLGAYLAGATPDCYPATPINTARLRGGDHRGDGAGVVGGQHGGG